MKDTLKTSGKPLCLTLKGEWYDLIKEKVKREEYREIKPYWVKRLLMDVSYHISIKEPTLEEMCKLIEEESSLIAFDFVWNKGDIIRFARGGHFHKSIPQMMVECEGMAVGEGNPKWGAVPGKKYFVIKLR